MARRFMAGTVCFAVVALVVIAGLPGASAAPRPLQKTLVRIVEQGPSGSGTYSFAGDLGTFQLTPGRPGQASVSFEVSTFSTVNVIQTGGQTALRHIRCHGDYAETQDLANSATTVTVGRSVTVLTFVNR